MTQPFDIAIDIGDAQPDIDWGALAESPILIVMIKATEGSGFVSPTYGAQLAGAQRAGKLAVPYHFLRPGGADLQVQHFIRTVRPAKNQPFALDWEGRASQTCTPQICEAMGTQLGVLTGRKPLGYWGIPGSTPAAPTHDMQQWDRWVPRYPLSGLREFADMPAATVVSRLPGGALFWQYTCWGRVPGIKVVVDRSVLLADSIDDARAWYATGQITARIPAAAADAPKPASAPAPAATSQQAPSRPPSAMAGDVGDDTAGEAEAEALNQAELSKL